MAQGGSPGWAPPFLFSNPTFRPPALPCRLDCDPSKRSASFPMSRCGGEQTDHLHGQPGRCWPLAGSFQGSRQLRRVLFFAVFFLPVTTASVESLANDPGEWRLLSRVQVNPPGVQAFVETFFSHNQLKSGPVGDLVLGFAAVPRNRTDTDVFLSRFVRSEDRWNPPVPFADSNDLERSAAIWIDRHSGAVHVAWVGNKRQKSRGTSSELRLGYRRSVDGGATWIPPRHFPVGTALARRPQLMGDGQGNLYLSISNGYRGKARTHPSVSKRRRWRDLAPGGRQFPRRSETGEHGNAETGRRTGRSCLHGLARRDCRTQGGRVQHDDGRFRLVGAGSPQ